MRRNWVPLVLIALVVLTGGWWSVSRQRPNLPGVMPQLSPDLSDNSGAKAQAAFLELESTVRKEGFVEIVDGSGTHRATSKITGLIDGALHIETRKELTPPGSTVAQETIQRQIIPLAAIGPVIVSKQGDPPNYRLVIQRKDKDGVIEVTIEEVGSGTTTREEWTAGFLQLSSLNACKEARTALKILIEAHQAAPIGAITTNPQGPSAP